MTTGLFLGKFAPLHRGHQHVIEHALAEVDDLVVLIYDCPDTTSIPLSVRARWIQDLYPSVRVLKAWNGPSEIGYTDEIKRRHEEYIDDLLGDARITHFYSSEPYGEHMSQALGAIDRRVDMAREHVPISGTRIRQDPYAHRNHLHPRVYRDLVVNVAVIGAPSTGKTTLCEALANAYSTVWMPEYGREYWAEHHADRRLSTTQLRELIEGHIEREERLLQEANGYLFTDTNALTTHVFSQYYHEDSDATLEELAEDVGRRYDIILVCDTDIPYEDTWDRSGEGNREVMQRRTLDFLHERHIPYVLLSGSLETRLSAARRALDGFTKFSNPAYVLARGIPRSRSSDEHSEVMRYA